MVRVPTLVTVIRHWPVGPKCFEASCLAFVASRPFDPSVRIPRRRSRFVSGSVQQVVLQGSLGLGSGLSGHPGPCLVCPSFGLAAPLAVATVSPARGSCQVRVRVWRVTLPPDRPALRWPDRAGPLGPLVPTVGAVPVRCATSMGHVAECVKLCAQGAWHSGAKRGHAVRLGACLPWSPQWGQGWVQAAQYS